MTRTTRCPTCDVVLIDPYTKMTSCAGCRAWMCPHCLQFYSYREPLAGQGDHAAEIRYCSECQAGRSTNVD